jgi:hypothetical protein
MTTNLEFLLNASIPKDIQYSNTPALHHSTTPFPSMLQRLQTLLPHLQLTERTRLCDLDSLDQVELLCLLQTEFKSQFELGADSMNIRLVDLIEKERSNGVLE